MSKILNLSFTHFSFLVDNILDFNRVSGKNLITGQNIPSQDILSDSSFVLRCLSFDPPDGQTFRYSDCVCCVYPKEDP